jgi:hypothetical protein
MDERTTTLTDDEIRSQHYRSEVADEEPDTDSDDSDTTDVDTDDTDADADGTDAS